MGLRMAYWFGFAAVAGAFGGLVAFGVQHVGYGPYLTGIGGEWDWKVLFLIEVSTIFTSSLARRSGKDVRARVYLATSYSVYSWFFGCLCLTQ
jgi:hypothetical protein